MKTLKYLGVATLITVGMGLASAGHAAVTGDTVVFGGAGSSALFNTLENAAIALGTSAHYSAKNGSVVHQAGQTDENANIWIVWTPGDAQGNNKKIYFYDQVDSTVGNRAFFNQNTNVMPATLVAPGNLNTTAPGTDVAPPPDVVTAVNNYVFNAAGTDITPYDALVQTGISQTLNGGTYVANGIQGANGKTAHPVSFDFHNYPNFVDTQIGAAPIVIFVNKTAALANADNIDRFTLSNILNGTLTQTDDVDINLASGGSNLTTFIREPLSGTYTTLEDCIPASKEVGSTQEAGVASNPLNETGYGGTPTGVGGRVRIVGTGDLVSAVSNTPDSLGYAFFSVANFAVNPGKVDPTHLKYLTVDGSDPILDSYAGGTLPTSGSSVTFRNVKNGGYPAWSLIRLVTAGALGTDLTAYVNQVRATDSGGDFVASSALKVFRSHRQVGTTAPHNGVTVSPERGADAGGRGLPGQCGDGPRLRDHRHPPVDGIVRRGVSFTQSVAAVSALLLSRKALSAAAGRST